MPRLQTYTDRPVVLLTNDDGPPCASSPNIFSFCKLLQSRLGWDVRVVIPDCQKSWVGKAYAISDIITASYFYPLEPDGLNGEITTTPRPLKEGETMEWVLLSSTPASCTNIALHNLYPGEIDLVISGPNHGRNSSTAFALSSGTLGAALAGALSVPVPGPSSGAVSLHSDHIPCIAVSYGVVTRPVTARVQDLATESAVEVCERLYNDWGYDQDPVIGRHLVQIYSVNIPLVEDVLEKEKRQIVWTNMWRNAYGGLFKPTKLDPSLNWWSNASVKTQPNQTSNLQSFATALQTSLQTVAEVAEPTPSIPPPSSASSQEKEIDKTSRQVVSDPPNPTSRSEAKYDPGDLSAQKSSASSQPNLPQNSSLPPHLSTTSTAGPGALPTPDPASPIDTGNAVSEKQLKFHFAPTMKPLLFPALDSLPVGSDAWAFAKGMIGVTPMRAEFAGPVDAGYAFGSEEGEGKQPGATWE